jgi:hypothetical protein
MTPITPTQDFIEKNFEKTISLINSFVKDEQRRNNLLNLFEKFAEKDMVSPASTRKDYYCCFPGGLCYHNLHVLKLMTKLNTTLEESISNESMLIVSLLHEFGKVGDLTTDYYIPYDDNWHIERGMFYDFNTKITYMRVAHRSLCLAQTFGIKLTQDEYITILLGDSDDENKAYNFKEPKLATLLRMADEWAIKTEKELTINFPVPME